MQVKNSNASLTMGNTPYEHLKGGMNDTERSVDDTLHRQTRVRLMGLSASSRGFPFTAVPARRPLQKRKERPWTDKTLFFVEIQQ